MIGCLRTRVHKQPIIVLYLEFENELKFYNFEARPSIRVFILRLLVSQSPNLPYADSEDSDQTGRTSGLI